MTSKIHRSPPPSWGTPASEGQGKKNPVKNKDRAQTDGPDLRWVEDEKTLSLACCWLIQRTCRSMVPSVAHGQKHW